MLKNELKAYIKKLIKNLLVVLDAGPKTQNIKGNLSIKVNILTF